MNPDGRLQHILEDELQRQVIGTKTKPGLARIVGWRAYHTLRSKGSEAGYPDWSLFRERHLYIELKREQGVVSAAQREWLRAITQAGVEAYIVRPRNLQDIATVLQARGPYETWSHKAVQARGALLLEVDEVIRTDKL